MRLAGFDYRDIGATYFVTTCTSGRRPRLALPEMAETVVENIVWARVHGRARVFAYCVMPDHLHLVLQLVDSRYSLGRVVGTLKRESGKRFHQMGYAGELWQERFYDRILRENETGISVVDYVLENPVRAGLVSHHDEYPYCGILDRI
jgi:REP element-mobilizing transposase RayT